MARPFLEILQELNHAYENLYCSKVALEKEVEMLRQDDAPLLMTACAPTASFPITGSQPLWGSMKDGDRNEPENGCMAVPAEGSLVRVGTASEIQPHPGRVASTSSDGKWSEKRVQVEDVRTGDHQFGGDFHANLHRLCDRLELVASRFDDDRNIRKERRLNFNRQESPGHGNGAVVLPKDLKKKFSVHTKNKILHHSLSGDLSVEEALQASNISSERKDRLKSTVATEFQVKWDGEMEKRSTLGSIIVMTSKAMKLQNQKQVCDFVSGIVTMTYISFLGAETEIQSRRIQYFESSFFIIHMIYNSIFALELVGRIKVSGCYSYFTDEGWRLNFLDVLLVLSTVFDVVLRTKRSTSTRMLRSIRVIRLVRTVRIVRAMGEVREFQKMVFAITSSMKTLFYSIIILFFILYFFAVIFTYAAIETREYNEHVLGDEDEVLDEYWGTFFKSIYACFLSVSTGQSWQIVVNPLANYSTYLTLCFIAFIALTLFGVLNAISSIFVESALMSAQHYKDLIILDKENEKELSLNHMRAVFNQIDEDKSGEISCAELEYFLAHDSLRKYMEALNISADDTRMLFRLLDTDGSGIIDIEEFCTGCMKLKGEARAFDMHVMLLQIKQFMEKWSSFTLYVAEQFTEMDNRVVVMNERVTRLTQGIANSDLL